MKFSMNGFRRQLHTDTKELKSICSDVINDELYDKDELVDLVNKVITHSNVINCVFVKDDPDFVDMGDLELEHLEN